MVLIVFAAFLIFGFLFKASMSYWRFILLGLACQLIAANLPESLSLIKELLWALNWLLPLGLALCGVLTDTALTPLARSLFFTIWALALAWGVWDNWGSYTSFEKPLQSSFTESKTTIYGPTTPMPGEKGADWEPLFSEEGCFRILSPLPAATDVHFRDLDKARLKITTTRIRDVDPALSYVVVTTAYPADFKLPETTEQATLALEHLTSTYGFDIMVEMKAVAQGGYDGLAFHAKNSHTDERMIGLILPTGPILYQVFVLSKSGQSDEESVSRFLTSLEPLSPTQVDAQRQSDQSRQKSQ